LTKSKNDFKIQFENELENLIWKKKRNSFLSLPLFSILARWPIPPSPLFSAR
jgi:hypothetical protein